MILLEVLKEVLEVPEVQRVLMALLEVIIRGRGELEKYLALLPSCIWKKQQFSRQKILIGADFEKVGKHGQADELEQETIPYEP